MIVRRLDFKIVNFFILIIAMLCSGCFLNASLSSTNTSTTIDSPGDLSLKAPAQISGNEGSVISVAIELPSSANKKDYHYELVPGSAVGGVHFVISSGTISFLSGETQKVITVQTNEIGLPAGNSKILFLKIYDSENKLVAETQVEILPTAQIQKVYDIKPLKAAPLISLDMGTYFLYVSKSPEHGAELWRSDGTPGGTFEIKDICPGACSSGITQFVKLGATVFFAAKETDNGNLALYKTDSTASGTTKVFDFSQISIQAGYESSEQLSSFNFCEGSSCGFGNRTLVASSGRLFFVLYNSDVTTAEHYTWFSTQGTLASTRSLAPMDDAARSASLVYDKLFVSNEDEIFYWDGAVNNGWTRILGNAGWYCGGMTSSIYQVASTFYFVCYDHNLGGPRVFTIDPLMSYTGSGLLSSLSTNSVYASGYNYLYFLLFDGTNMDIYRTNGTAGGTIKVLDGTGFSAGIIGNVNSKTIFYSGTNIYSTDGTVIGTSSFKTISNPTVGPIGTINGYLYYNADGNLNRTDGTAGGTSVVTSTDGQAFSIILPKHVSATEIFFQGYTSSRGVELWKISSTGVLQLVSELYPGTSNSFPGSVFKMLGNTYVSFADDTGNVLYQIDNSMGISKSVVKSWAAPAESETINSIQELNGKVYWLQNSRNSNAEIKSFSSEAGTNLEAILTAYGSSELSPIAILGNIGNKLLMSGRISMFSFRWGISFDTESKSATTMTSFVPDSMIKLSSTKAIVSAKDVEIWSNSNFEPYVTDGSIAGTSRIADLVAGTTGSAPIFLGILNSKAIFSTSLGLYQSDGTAVGTTFIIQPNFNLVPAMTTYLLGNKIIFAASTVATGLEIWETDGTASGTSILKDIGPAGTGGFIKMLPNIANSPYVLFIGNDGNNGQEIWRTDGTTAGTVMIANLCPAACSTNVMDSIEFNGKVYFSIAVDNPTPMNMTESKIYSTDGTAPGTMLFKNLLPQVKGKMYKTSTTLFFAIGDLEASNGSRLYRYKPSYQPDIELYPGLENVVPTLFGVYDNKLLYSTESPTTFLKTLYFAK